MATDTAPPAASDGTEASRYVQPAIDVAELAALLDGKYAEIRGLVRTNLAEYSSILEEAETMTRDEFRERVKQVVVEMASTGQTGMGFPEEYGGGGDIGASVAAFETLAYGDLSVLVKVGVQFGLFGGAILQLGTEEHHEAYLPDLITGRLMGCFAMTETGHGSNVQALGTVATYDVATQEFVITTHGEQARKDYIGNAAKHAEVAVVFAQLEVGGTSEGVHAFVVPDPGGRAALRGRPDRGRRRQDGAQRRRQRPALVRRRPGAADGAAQPVRRRHPGGGLRERDREPQPALLHHARHPRPGPRLRRRRGDQRRQGRADHRGEVRPAAPAVRGELGGRGGAAPRLRHAPAPAAPAAGPDLRAALRAGGGGRPAARRLLRGIAATTSTPAASWSRGRPAPRRSAPGTRTRTIQECREACGGAGYLSVNRFAALKADTDVFTTFEGDNHVLLQLVAKGLLTDYASEFEDMDQFGMVRFVAGMAVETVIERTNVHKLLERIKDLLPGGDQWDQEAGLLDPDYQLAMLRFREEHMLAGVARRLKRGIDQKMNPGVVFSRVQDHVIAAARAHVERLVLEAFVAKARSLPDGDLKVAVNLLCDLHALTHDRGGPGLVHGARPAHGAAVQGDQPRDRQPVPQDPPAGRGPRRRVRRTRRDAAGSRT